MRERTVTVILVLFMTVHMMWSVDLARLVPSMSQRLTGYEDVDSVMASIDRRGAAGIEGLWLMSGSQSLVSIEPVTDPSITRGSYNLMQIVLVSSPRKALKPGTVLGYLQPAGKAGSYDGRLYTGKYRSLLQRHRQFAFTLTDEGHLTVKKGKSPLRFSLRHTFNFLFRAGVYMRDADNESTEGFIKQYPWPGGKPLTPVYL
ncbi:MAG: hypothetical protein NC082_07430 [Clostridiales bacterium]|nr:hypothetical protein [Clostridiales bacterium]